LKIGLIRAQELFIGGGQFSWEVGGSEISEANYLKEA